MNPYDTLEKESYFEFTEKRSLFIGIARPVSSEDEAIAFINSVRRKYPDARHNVYAYSILADNVFSKRFSDDGEPQGTAGMPVLDVLEKRGITNAAVTVTRYFGGILLGAPGLLRAYTTAASGAVTEAGKIHVSVCRKVSFSADYSLYGRIEKSFQSFPVQQEPPVFSDKVLLSFHVDISSVDAFVKNLTDITSGTASVSVSDPYYFRFQALS